MKIELIKTFLTATHNSIVIRILFVIILFQKKCVSVDDLPFHVQLGVRKGRSVEDGKYTLYACIIITTKLQ